MLTENTAQKARLPLCADRRIARARLLVDALLEASELTAEKLTAALRSILAELRCASDVLAQNRALEILEAIQYALEMGQEPGSILAEGNGWDRYRIGSQANYDDYVRHGFPMGRLGTAEEVADVIVFLASARAHWINGRNIPVDGLEQPYAAIDRRPY